MISGDVAKWPVRLLLPGPRVDRTVPRVDRRLQRHTLVGPPIEASDGTAWDKLPKALVGIVDEELEDELDGRDGSGLLGGC